MLVVLVFHLDSVCYCCVGPAVLVVLVYHYRAQLILVVLMHCCNLVSCVDVLFHFIFVGVGCVDVLF